MKKKALITGISGQDGSYLAEYLLENNYEVHGIIRRHSVAENQDVIASKWIKNGFELALNQMLVFSGHLDEN